MACTKVLVILACLALSHAAVVKREAPASPLEDIEKHAAEFQKTFGEQLNTFMSSKNTQEFQKAIKDGSEAVLQQLNSLTASVQSAIGDASGKAKEALETTRANLQKSAEELRKAHPEVQTHANSLKDKIQSVVENALQETQKLAKEVSANVEQTNQKLAPKLKQAYDDFVKQVEVVQKNIHDAADKQ